MIEGIKHIIFDLGGVLLNIDYQLTEDSFIAAGIPDFKRLYSQAAQTTLFNDLETGKIEKEEFIGAIRGIVGQPISDERILHAWNAMLLSFPLRRLQLLQQLRLHYDLLLLSNTNEIHEATFNEILMREHGIPNIGVFFDKVYLSHRVGLRKPGREIYARVLEDNDLNPDSTLFIDDSLQNIEGAAALGIKTIYLEKGMTIEEHIFKPIAK